MAVQDIQAVDRPDPKGGITEAEVMASALVSSTGVVTHTSTSTTVEFPTPEHAAAFSEYLNELGFTETPQNYDGNLGWTFAKMYRPLPQRRLLETFTTGFDRRYRGSKAALWWIKGALKDAGSTGYSSGQEKNLLTLYVRNPMVARAVQMESMLAGATFPEYDAGEGLDTLLWAGHAATLLYRALELPIPKIWNPNVFHLYKSRRHKMHIIKEIRTAEPQYVYDFTVPLHHNFTANSMIVHNTVPKHSYWGKRLRECIIAPEGYKILGCDYSQGELKVAACWAQEQKMIEAYLNDIDLHTLTAATANGLTYEEAMHMKLHNTVSYKALRQGGKAGNFGLLYGMGAYGFMMYAEAVYGVVMTLEEAEEMRNSFFDLYPGLIPWHQKQINEARTTGQVRSPMGMVRRLHHINSSNKKTRNGAENQAINSPIQGTLGQMMWWAMAIIHRERPDIIPFGNVHDQGLWYIPENTWQADTDYVANVMQTLPFEECFGWKPELAFTVDAEVGSTLATIEGVALNV
jgi:hypothetical protein